MLWLIVGLVTFLGIHSVSIFAPAWRDSMVARIGALSWRGVYSVVSIVSFLVLVHGCGLARQEPVVIYQPPIWIRHVSMLLMLPAFVLLLAAYLPGRIKAKVKHPMLAATKTWAVAHLLANGMLADVVLFGGFLLWAVLDRISVGRRPVVRKTPGAPPGRFNDAIAVIGGLALYGLFVVWAHGRLIGMPLLH
jgi:uncharacterized membrane protein